MASYTPMVLKLPHFFSVWPLCLVLGLASSCEIIDPEEEIPAVLQIDSMGVAFTDASHGSTSSKITDAWVFIDDELIGVFELPATVPILEKGDHELMIGAGVQVSGQAGRHDSYPFYQAYIDPAFHLTPGETIHINPTVAYRPEGTAYKYQLIEDFEIPFELKIDSVQKSASGVQRTTEPSEVLEGKASGKIQVPAGKTTILQTKELYALPGQGKVAYIELDYKTNTDFTVGIFADFDVSQDLYVNYIVLDETSGWNKIYINITEPLSDYMGAEGYALYLQITDPPEDGTVFIDNLKLMYQK